MDIETIGSHPEREGQWLSKKKLRKSAFIAIVKYFYSVDPEIEEYISRNTSYHQLRKWELLVTENTTCSNLYHLQKGIVRSYIKRGTKEITTWVTCEQELVTCISSLGLNQPCRENIQALDNCELSAISFDCLQNLYIDFPEFNLASRKILEKYYRDAEERAFIARIPDVIDRYNYFAETQRSLFNKVPLKYIASYLGTTPETISRIRAKLSGNKNVNDK